MDSREKRLVKKLSKNFAPVTKDIAGEFILPNHSGVGTYLRLGRELIWINDSLGIFYTNWGRTAGNPDQDRLEFRNLNADNPGTGYRFLDEQGSYLDFVVQTGQVAFVSSSGDVLSFTSGDQLNFGAPVNKHITFSTTGTGEIQLDSNLNFTSGNSIIPSSITLKMGVPAGLFNVFTLDGDETITFFSGSLLGAQSMTSTIKLSITATTGDLSLTAGGKIINNTDTTFVQGMSVSLLTVTGATTLNDTHYVVLGNSTSAFTITLPAAASHTDRVYEIKNINTGVITIDGNSSETIDGSTTIALSAQYDSVTIVCDGTNWHII